MAEPGRNRVSFGSWPWIVLLLTVLPAIWYVVDYEHEVDPEFPRVARQTYNAFPPAAYRFAEPGDTIDHVGVYVTAAAVVLCIWGCLQEPKRGLRYAALVLSLAAFYHAATPGPPLDGWYGTGWRTIFEPAAPRAQRLILGGAALSVIAIVGFASRPWSFSFWIGEARSRGVLGLLSTAAALLAVRQWGGIDREPFGFWPRWVFVWGAFAWAFAVLRLTPEAAPGRRRRAVLVAMLFAWLGLDFVGRGLIQYQRPLARLREVTPGKVYLSAMPTPTSLRLAHERHSFKTIVNLFPEFSAQGSPYWKAEQDCARSHGINIVNQPPDDPTGERFVQLTLKMAADPACQPLLVHCHASMDRSPAWVGLYRFAVEGWPVRDAIAEIERHRGSRPKSSVTLLYNRMLPILDPARAESDPTAQLLRRNAEGTVDPAIEMAARAARGEKSASRPVDDSERR